jgi:hypothetical protein
MKYAQALHQEQFSVWAKSNYFFSETCKNQKTQRCKGISFSSFTRTIHINHHENLKYPESPNKNLLLTSCNAKVKTRSKHLGDFCMADIIIKSSSWPTTMVSIGRLFLWK